MDKEFVYNIENGNYYVLDFVNQRVQQTNSRGKFPENFTPLISGFCNSKQRKLRLQYHNSVSYTPHQNKYFGYCQCPNQKVKPTSQEKVCIINKTSDRTNVIKQSLPVNLNNCFNKPKTPNITQTSSTNPLRYRVSENNFDDNLINHLSASLKDASQVYKSGSIESMKYRKGTKIMDKQVKLKNQEPDQLRFTCRYLNNKKVKSPPYKVMQRYDIINKINQEQDRKIAKSIDDKLIKRIPPVPHLQTLPSRFQHKSYKNVDISLSHSIEAQKIKAFISQR
ncbi:unnamed protein product [Paramecium sonneborni]|uniref:Uncharacterized protein n=1 Tax=Paramecium sonneborni TaxID=65129 RepID=A0A8S1QVX4_9CILI|nr:unnamed protein product [Paramecium sonneborni]CAD8119710.1 unnamed protein product [Paramecium sonneborni]